MTFFLRKYIVFLVVLMLCCMSLSCSREAVDVREFRLSLILGMNSDWYRGAERFAELVDQESGGRYRVRIFPHAQLAGNQRSELEMLQTGVIDFALESSILLSLIEPSMSVMSLPWLFDNYGTANAVCDGEAGEQLLGLLPEKNIVGLAFGVNGFRQLTNSRGPVRTPDDLAAMKLRVPGIRMYIDLFKLLGADPSAMNFAEVFTALAQGTMDGQENPISVIYYSRLYEVQRYLTCWNYSYDPIILCANGDLWESLPPADRSLIQDCARKAMRYERNLVENGEAALLDSLAVKGMEIASLTKTETEAFRQMAKPAYDRLVKVTGYELIEMIQGSVEKMGGE